MDDAGRIRHFASDEDAVTAGFRTHLTALEAKRLARLPEADRHAALAAMRADPGWRPTPHARRTKSRGVLRRMPQSVRRAMKGGR